MAHHLHIVIIPITFRGHTTIVNATVQRYHITALFKYVNERKKIGSLQTIFVQIVRSSIACCYHHNALIEQVSEQAFQDHCIGYVCDLCDDEFFDKSSNSLLYW